jgi:hypothetical protein
MNIGRCGAFRFPLKFVRASLLEAANYVVFRGGWQQRRVAWLLCGQTTRVGWMARTIFPVRMFFDWEETLHRTFATQDGQECRC